MKNTKIQLQATIPLAAGILANVDSEVDMTDEQLAETLRSRVQLDCKGFDDAGCDWCYDEKTQVVCIDQDPTWIASRKPKHVMMMKLADMLDGANNAVKPEVMA